MLCCVLHWHLHVLPSQITLSQPSLKTEPLSGSAQGDHDTQSHLTRSPCWSSPAGQRSPQSELHHSPSCGFQEGQTLDWLIITHKQVSKSQMWLMHVYLWFLSVSVLQIPYKPSWSVWVWSLFWWSSWASIPTTQPWLKCVLLPLEI